MDSDTSAAPLDQFSSSQLVEKSSQFGMTDSSDVITTITGDNLPRAASADLLRGFTQYDFWSRFAVHDIRQRFRRSILGPFWLTLTMGTMVAALGLVFGTIFRQNIGDLLPYIATGVIFWGLLSTCIAEGATVFTAAESFIRNVPLPISAHLYRMIARNVIILVFNLVIYVAVVIIFHKEINAAYLLAIPGFTLLLLNAMWLSLVAGVLSTRYRDIPQVITNVLQVVFMVTPIFWTTDSMPSRPAFVLFNPIYHILEVVREPLLGRMPSYTSWLVSVFVLIVGGTLAILLYRRAYARLPYWL